MRDYAERMRVLVTGASGFVGRHITRRLQADGHQVTGLARTQPDNGPAVVDWALGDVVTGSGVEKALTGADAVVHLVGIIREKPGATFEQVHVEGTRTVLAAASQAGVRRFLHMSALGADPASASGYGSSKGRAETLVRESGLAWTIFRPDMILGVGDDFFSGTLRDLVLKPPVIPVVGNGAYPFRPITAHDVAAAFGAALERPATAGSSLDLVGPRQYTLRELQVLVRDTIGVKKPLVNVPLPLMRLGIALLRLLPSPPITFDEFLMLTSTTPSDPAPAVTALGLELQAIEDHLATVLAAAN